jgi:EpsI family protein
MKTVFPIRSLVALTLMGTSAWLTAAVTPNIMLADEREPVALTSVVPESFGEWHVDKSAPSLMVEPELQRSINAVYAQTISRIYVNDRGEHIMLAVAYGRDQTDTLQVHLPEGCYQGQGFAVNESVPALLPTSYGTIPVQHMVAQRDMRHEAVTYWVVVGNRFATDEWQRKKIKLSYALERTVPDGILIRVSSITPDSRAGFALQQKFIDAMLAGAPVRQRQVLLGAQGS